MHEMEKGYNPDFLGQEFRVRLPGPGLEIEDDILINDRLRDSHIADYVHYSIVMSKYNRQAYFSAANLDQNSIKAVKGRNWFIDPRIGLENQIGPEAYYANPWDRGHLTRRTAVTWGTTYWAKKASNQSCSYANASLQHENFNQDEWRVPEEIVRYFDKDKDGKLTVITGPIFTKIDRWYTRRTLKQRVRIPSGFWKVIAYIGKKSRQLESQAFVMYQDDISKLDKRGKYKLDIHNYQVTITEIEQLTGLEFDESLYNSNPLYFFPRPGINKGPEGYITPKSLKDDELKKGIIFSRDDTQLEPFKKRKREIQADEFVDLLNQLKDA